VVDDGSTDGMSDIAAALPGIRYLRNRRNIGYGGSLKRGIKAAKYETIVITDADGSYPTERIPDLVELLDESTDMVVGWRKGLDANIPIERRPAKWMVRQFAQKVAGYSIPDINSGLRVFRRQFIMDHESLFPSGFSFTTTLTLLVASSGGNVVYEPVDYYKREGKSKFRPIRDTWGMLTLIIRSVMLFNPLRVFTMIAMALIFAGGIFLLLSAILPVTYRATTTILVSAGVQFLGMGLLADLINRRSR
jgi:glycosyltransferase involved in cell wall biosynthesis